MLRPQGKPSFREAVEGIEMRHIKVIKDVNFIAARIFGQICTQIFPVYMHLIYHLQVTWLPRQEVLQRVLALNNEVEAVWLKTSSISSKVENSKWILQQTSFQTCIRTQ